MLVLRNSENQSYKRDNYGVKLTVIKKKKNLTVIVLYDWFEKTSLCGFYCKVSTVTPIKTKQETV